MWENAPPRLIHHLLSHPAIAPFCWLILFDFRICQLSNHRPIVRLTCSDDDLCFFMIQCYEYTR